MVTVHSLIRTTVLDVQPDLSSIVLNGIYGTRTGYYGTLYCFNQSTLEALLNYNLFFCIIYNLFQLGILTVVTNPSKHRRELSIGLS